MMTGQKLGVGHDGSRGAAYVDNWIKVLNKEPREIYHAAAEAEKISDYLVEPVRAREAEQEKKHEELAKQKSPTKPGRRSATLPARRQKRKHRKWNGTRDQTGSPVRITSCLIRSIS